MLFRFVIVFLPRSKCLLISWLQSSSAVILEPNKIKSATVSIVSHLFAMKWWDWMPWSWNGSKIKVPNYSNNFLLSLLLVLTAAAHQSLLPLQWSCLWFTSMGTWTAWGGEGSELFEREIYPVWKTLRTKPGHSAFGGNSAEPAPVLNKPCCSASLSATCLFLSSWFL